MKTASETYHNGTPVLTPAQIEKSLVLSNLFFAGDFEAYVSSAPAFLAEVEATSAALPGESWEGPRFALGQIARGLARKIETAKTRVRDRAEFAGRK